MRIQYLGTAAAEGIPAMFCACDVCKRARTAGGRNIRFRSCAMVEHRVMIDFPPDMFTFQTRYGLNLAQLEAAFFTHAHIDHLAASELAYRCHWYCHGASPAALRLYGNAKVLDTIRAAFDFDLGHLPDCVTLRRVEPFETVVAGGVSFTALPANHDPKEQCLLYLLEQGGARLLYANDTAVFPMETFSYLREKRLDVVSLDCTNGKLPCPRAHMGFPENLQIKEELCAIGAADEGTRFFSTHFSHNGLINYEDFARMAEGSGFESSYDGMVVEI